LETKNYLNFLGNVDFLIKELMFLNIKKIYLIMNYKDYVINKLSTFKKEDVILTDHTRIRIIQRQLKVEDIIENIINPKRLEYAIKDKAESPNEEKFDCYFGFSKSQCHRYVLVIKNKVIVVTAIKINRRWQKIVEKKLKR